MTTDNRTNEPTPEQIEVAAVASINSHRSRAGLPALAALDGVPNADEWRDDARAALEAAARAAHGAVSQAERDWRLDVVPEPWTDPAPVLPPSTAPQAEAYVHCCNHPKCPGGSLCCCASEQRLRDCWNQWREEVAGDTKQAFRDAYSAGRNDPAPWAVAPVLPSSGVDEDKLAEVIDYYFDIPSDRLELIARALCEAYTEGKLI